MNYRKALILPTTLLLAAGGLHAGGSPDKQDEPKDQQPQAISIDPDQFALGLEMLCKSVPTIVKAITQLNQLFSDIKTICDDNGKVRSLQTLMADAQTQAALRRSLGTFQLWASQPTDPARIAMFNTNFASLDSNDSSVQVHHVNVRHDEDMTSLLDAQKSALSLEKIMEDSARQEALKRLLQQCMEVILEEKRFLQENAQAQESPDQQPAAH